MNLGMPVQQREDRQGGVEGASPISRALLARNTLLNLSGHVVPRIVALLAIPFIIRGLGAEGYGIFSLALIVLGYLGLFDLGLGRATTKFVAEYLGRKDTQHLSALICTSLALQFVLGALGGLVFAVAAPLLVGKVFNIVPAMVVEAKIAFIFLAAALPFVLGAATLQGVLTAAQRVDLANAVSIPAHAATFLIAAITASLGFRLPNIIFLLFLSWVGTAGAYLLLCLRVFPSLRKGPSFEVQLIRPLLTYGSWVAVTSLMGPVLLYLDRVLIGVILSMGAIAYYTAAHQLATALWILPTSLVATVFPAFTTLRARGSPQLATELYARSLKALLLTVGPLALLVVFFARDILWLWLGAEFAEQSGLVLRILALGVLVNSLGWVPFYFLQALGRPDLTAKLYVCELPFYAGAAWFLTSKMGLAGAALAWTLRVALDAALLFGACSVSNFVPTRTLTQNHLGRSVAVLAALGAALLLPFLAVRWVVTHTFLIVLIVALFAIAAWHYGLDSTDRKSLAVAVTELSARIQGQR